jgi:hypothetical protein
MAASGGALLTWVGSFFTAGTAAAGAGTAAAGAADAAAVGTAAGADALTTTAAANVAATSAAGVAAAAAPTAVSVAPAVSGTQLVAGATTAATGLSAINTLAQGRGGINIPPTPGQVQSDQTVLNAQQEELQREQAAGGLQGTTGTPGGQAGAILAPSTTSNRSILGG